MKKIIFVCLIFLSMSVRSEIVDMNEKKSKDNALFIDERGLYRYKRAEDVYQANCQDSSTEAIRKRCLMAEKSVWERGKTAEEIKKQGTLFTGKIKVHSDGKDSYFYVNDGKEGEKIRLLLKRYYYENDLLYDIKTEAPFSGEIVIGGVEGLTSGQKAPRFIIQQKYERGLPVGNPEAVRVE